MKNPNENLHENPCWQCKQMIMLWTNVNDNEKHKNIITTLISSLKLPKKERWCKITINSHHLPRVWQHLVQGRRNAVEGTLTSPPHPMWALLSKLLYIHAYVIYVCVNIYNNIYMCVCKCIYIYAIHSWPFSPDHFWVVQSLSDLDPGRLPWGQIWRWGCLQQGRPTGWRPTFFLERDVSIDRDLHIHYIPLWGLPFWDGCP